MFINKPLPRPKAFLVGLCHSTGDLEAKERSLEELARLADTSGLETIGFEVQVKPVIERSTYLGKGFLQRVVDKMAMKDAEILIFDNELSPTQARNISKTHKVEVVDRTEVILNIFHDHAKTKEAKLQVRLAELQYQLPRLKRLWSHLDRERGAHGSGTGASRGMGEKQIEVDKRMIRGEIKRLNIQLHKIMKHKETQRKQRENVKKVCLVGYTNAGKSTLFNRLTNAGVLVEDKLFATLDSTARAFNLGKGQDIILADTVGFISNLPHHLVASFRATLKEVSDADLLLHIIDISDEDCEKYISEVNKVLNSIEAESIPSLLIFNKIDNLPKYRVKSEIFETKYPRAKQISAHTGENIELLLEQIDALLHQNIIEKFMIPFEESRKVAYIYEYGKVISKKNCDDGIMITAEINKEDLKPIKKFISSVKE